MNRAHSGIALVTAIMVVAVASLAATALLASANMAIHRTGALRDTEQGLWLARGVESWVRGILKKDASDSQYDGLDEAWSQPVDYLPVDHGFVRGQIVDQQGLFNLNNLAQTSGRHAQFYEQQFLTLLRNLPGDIAVPPGLVASIRDWTDPDQNPSPPSGAEDTVYLNLELPYRTADRLFTAVSELLAIQGVTPELYAALRGLITALPAETPINVNTAPEAVLRSLPIQDEGALMTFLRDRVESPEQTVAGVIARGMFDASVTPERIAVASEYFLMQGEVFIGSSRTALYSLLHRPRTGNVVVLAHSAAAD